MNKGFSLIEVIAVVTALGVLLLLGIPQYKSFHAKTELKNSAYLLKDIIELAKAEAQKSASDVYIWNQNQSSRDLNNVQVIEIAKDLGGGNSSMISTLKLPSNVTTGCIEEEDNEVLALAGQSCYATIKQNGATDNNKRYSLNLSHAEVDKSYTVTISKTGAVAVSEEAGLPAGSGDTNPLDVPTLP